MEVTDDNSCTILTAAYDSGVPAGIPYDWQNRALEFYLILKRPTQDVPDNEACIVCTTRQVIAVRTEGDTINGTCVTVFQGVQRKIWSEHVKSRYLVLADFCWRSWCIMARQSLRPSTKTSTSFKQRGPPQTTPGNTSTHHMCRQSLSLYSRVFLHPAGEK